MDFRVEITDPAIDDFPGPPLLIQQWRMCLSAGDKPPDDFIEVIVRADPKPISGVAADSRERTILQTKADRPKPRSEWLPMKRAMTGIRLP